MKRKVVKHGPSTFVVSLPSNWVKLQNIKKGDEIELIEDGKRLVIGSNLQPKILEGKVDISALDRTSIIYVIRGFYRAGYDLLHVTFNKPTTIYQREEKTLNVLSVIHSEMNRLVGYELLEEGKRHCLIKDIQSVDIKNFDQALRRIFLLLNSMAEEFLESITEHDVPSLETIEEKHNTITKFISYCIRLLNKQSNSDARTMSYYITTLLYLEDITDIFKYAARDLRANNDKIDSAVEEIAGKVISSIKSYAEIFYKYDEK
ncbi:phosphate uptake regulator PhoU, partial [Candidatus Woesearchaeota archaeon]|nr:phosphate uptake regulator PhoU [Candidatus Woesearchaeota archaeon]